MTNPIKLPLLVRVVSTGVKNHSLPSRKDDPELQVQFAGVNGEVVLAPFSKQALEDFIAAAKSALELQAIVSPLDMPKKTFN